MKNSTPRRRIVDPFLRKKSLSSVYKKMIQQATCPSWTDVSSVELVKDRLYIIRRVFKNKNGLFNEALAPALAKWVGVWMILEGTIGRTTIRPADENKIPIVEVFTINNQIPTIANITKEPIFPKDFPDYRLTTKTDILNWRTIKRINKLAVNCWEIQFVGHKKAYLHADDGELKVSKKF